MAPTTQVRLMWDIFINSRVVDSLVSHCFTYIGAMVEIQTTDVVLLGKSTKSISGLEMQPVFWQDVLLVHNFHWTKNWFPIGVSTFITKPSFDPDANRSGRFRKFWIEDFTEVLEGIRWDLTRTSFATTVIPKMTKIWENFCPLYPSVKAVQHMFAHSLTKAANQLFPPAVTETYNIPKIRLV